MIKSHIHILHLIKYYQPQKIILLQLLNMILLINLYQKQKALVQHTIINAIASQKREMKHNIYSDEGIVSVYIKTLTR